MVVVLVLVFIALIAEFALPPLAKKHLRVAPAPATPREYTASDIRHMDEEAQYRKELRAARMGYCLLPRDSENRRTYLD